MNLLVTGARAYTSLDIARHFKEAGWTVYLADSVRFPVSRASSFVEKAFFVPSPRESIDSFVRAIEDIIDTYKITLVLPLSEEIFYVARFRERLSSRTGIACDSIENLKLLHNKWSFSQWTKGLSIEAPTTHLLTSQDDLLPFRESPSRYVFKKVYSRFATGTFICPDALPTLDLTSAPYLAQEYVPGREFCSYHYAVNGDVTASACYEPVHRAGPASGFYFKPADPGIANRFAREVAKKLSFTGHLSFDYIAGRDRWHVLECNPRTTSGLHLLADSDLASAILGTSVIEADPSRTRSKMIGYAMLTKLHARKGRRDFIQADDILMSERQLLPYHLLSLMETAKDALTKRISFKDAATANIEWDGEA